MKVGTKVRIRTANIYSIPGGLVGRVVKTYPVRDDGKQMHIVTFKESGKPDPETTGDGWSLYAHEIEEV